MPIFYRGQTVTLYGWGLRVNPPAGSNGGIGWVRNCNGEPLMQIRAPFLPVSPSGTREVL